MTELKSVQKWIMDYLKSGEKNPIIDLINPNGNLKTTPLDIYRESIFANHREAFAQTYVVIERLVGQTFFDFVLMHYLKAKPHQNYDISLYGDDFASFLEAFEPCKHLSYLPDVARLEWMCNMACLGKSYPIMDYEGLSQLNEQQQCHLCFELPPSSSLFASEYPILKIWEVNQVGYEGPQEVCLEEGGDKLFIWRCGLDLRIDRLTDAEHFCLWALQNKQTLEKMFYVLSKDYILSDKECQEILSKMMQRGWLVGFTVLE